MKRFWNQPSRAYRNFILVYTLLAANFIIPTMSYIFSPQTALDQFVSLNALLGGAAYPIDETASYFWWVLGSANVAALGFMCLYIARDLRDRKSVVVPLTMLKSTAATLWLASFVQHPEYPAFLAAAVLDYVTSFAFVYFASVAHRDIETRDDDELVPRPASAPAKLARSEVRLANSMLSVVTSSATPDAQETYQRIAAKGSPELRVGFRSAIWVFNFFSWVRFGTSFDQLDQAQKRDLIERSARSKTFVVRQLCEVFRFVGRLRYETSP